MVIPHNNMSVGIQMFGRRDLRNTLLGTYQTRSELDRLPQGKGDVLQKARKRRKRWLSIRDILYH